KLLVTDGTRAMLGGLCIGDEWAGNPQRRRLPWRDTMVLVCGPAAAALDAAFGRIWRAAGDPLPRDEFAADPPPEPCGDCTMLVDQRWARVGSSNLNVSSLLTNYELDVLAEGGGLCDALAEQFRRDLGSSREIALQARRLRLPPRLVGASATALSHAADAEHKRSGYELGAVAVVALRRVAGGLRRAIAATGALTFAGVGSLLLLFPKVTSVALATGA